VDGSGNDDDRTTGGGDDDGEEQSANSDMQKIVEEYRLTVKAMSLAELIDVFEQPATEPASLILRSLAHREILRRRHH
jgi:hypothetical protein